MSNEVTTETKNVAIARFENRKFFGKYAIDDYGPHHGLKYPEMKYHTSWDWLMPVVKKIRSMHFDILKQIGVLSYMNAAAPMNSALISIDIEKLHSGVYNFLLWYNQQKQTNEQSTK